MSYWKILTVHEATKNTRDTTKYNNIINILEHNTYISKHLQNIDESVNG